MVKRFEGRRKIYKSNSCPIGECRTKPTLGCAFSCRYARGKAFGLVDCEKVYEHASVVDFQTFTPPKDLLSVATPGRNIHENEEEVCWNRNGAARVRDALQRDRANRNQCRHFHSRSRGLLHEHGWGGREPHPGIRHEWSNRKLAAARKQPEFLPVHFVFGRLADSRSDSDLV